MSSRFAHKIPFSGFFSVWQTGRLFAAFGAAGNRRPGALFFLWAGRKAPAFCLQLGQQLFERHPVLFIAELAADLGLLLLGGHLFQLGPAEAGQRPLDPGEAAVAPVAHRAAVQQLGIKPVHRQLHDLLGALARAEQSGHTGHFADVLLDLADLGLGGAGQQLDECADPDDTG